MSDFVLDPIHCCLNTDKILQTCRIYCVNKKLLCFTEIQNLLSVKYNTTRCTASKQTLSSLLTSFIFPFLIFHCLSPDFNMCWSVSISSHPCHIPSSQWLIAIVHLYIFAPTVLKSKYFYIWLDMSSSCDLEKTTTFDILSQFLADTRPDSYQTHKTGTVLAKCRQKGIPYIYDL